ncbi:MAG: hypothetical protein IJC58_00105 [Oscillospiraceae bacterium]|nr:hypothetical protein [Oscillospiraceae bacterium]
MLALKIIGIIVLIFLLISLIRVGAVIEFGGELTVSLAVGPLRVKILPAKEKKEKKKKPPKKKKEKTQKPKEAAPKKKRKITLKQVKELLGILWPAIKKTLRRVGRGIRISPLRLSIIVGGDDPSKVAETYGWLSQAVWGAMPQLEKLMDIRKPFIHTGFDFDAVKTAVSGKVGVTMRIGTGFAIVFGLIGPGIRALMVLTKKEETKTLNTGERKESDYEQAE